MGRDAGTQGGSASAQPPASPWFTRREARPGVWLIGEGSHVSSWLVIGSERAALVDSGLGLWPIRPVVEQITDRPVVVVCTHAHFDHIGGNAEFDRLVAGARSAPLLGRPLPEFVLPAYARTVRDEEERDRAHDAAPAAPPFPSARDWRIAPRAPDQIVADGDVIDLGDRGLRVVETPGHSVDGITLLDERAGFAFVGDLVYDGVNYAHLPDADLDAYAASLRRLDATSPAALFAGHAQAPIVDRLDLELARLLEDVADGSAALSPYVDVLGQRALMARRGEIGLSVPDPAHPPRSIVADPPSTSR